MIDRNSAYIRWGIIVGFFLLAGFHLSPVQMQYKGFFPLTFLTLCSLLYPSRYITLAMFFSAIGDLMGICHNFWAQMGAFALAHVAYVCFFAQRFRRESMTFSLRKEWLGVGLACVVWGVVYALIAPHVHPLALRVGVMTYALLILVMCWSACLQRSAWFALGAVLFVFSDFVLGWNKFVSPIENARYWIMVPYFLGQWMLFYRSTK